MPTKKKSKPARAKATKSKPKTAKPARKTASAKPGFAVEKILERRLMALAKQMDKTLAAVMVQALSEFADAWEDHFRTIKNLQDDYRVQLTVERD